MKLKKQTTHLLAYILGLAFIINACSSTEHSFRSNYKSVNKLLYETKNIQQKPFLKAHLRNGNVYILKDSWQIDTASNILTGNGVEYNFNRVLISEGVVNIPIENVAIFETNKKLQKPEDNRIATLAILVGLDVIVGIICLSNPKACFGSCPTFYINEEDNFHYADAEGFSNAIIPAMEYYDIDALGDRTLTQNVFSLTMKNEALETHCVNNVKLLAYPIENDERVFQSPTNDFYLCENSYFLSQATGNEGDITLLLMDEDRQERFSFSDMDNLNSKEEIFLTFDNVDNIKQLGLILDFRQTLMTSYFIYSAMGYMGDKVGDVFANMEINSEVNEKLKKGIKKELGNIDIYSWNEQKNDWDFQDGFYETGPIAINKQLIPLKSTSSCNSKIKLKLVLNKGLWRIDFAALTNIKEKVKPIEISPNSILNKGKFDPAALAEIRNPKKHLVSMPGSEYKFSFSLPDTHNYYELFLYSKGYYLEWMRAHWIKDKDLLKLRQMVNNPKKYLRVEAKRYKQFETLMEEEFWNSKIDTKTFSYHEN